MFNRTIKKKLQAKYDEQVNFLQYIHDNNSEELYFNNSFTAINGFVTAALSLDVRLDQTQYFKILGERSDARLEK